MKKNLLFIILSTLILVGCQKVPYEKTRDGVIINLHSDNPLSAKKIRLQIITDDIIRVSATPTNNFSKKKSLITVYDPTETVNYEIAEQDGTITLKTATTIARVSLATGEIVFTDLDGNVLLAENKGGGKAFSGKTLQQIFESTDDEAFYGLGQHQADEFNYKGKNEELYQYNTKVSIPFVLSSKNYGILWDNYSLTRFGDNRPYANLDQFTLYDKNGKAGGLTATYKGETLIERTEPSIDYENLETTPNFPKDFKFYNSQITWEGELEAPETGTYHFILYYAGYTTLYLDENVLVEERWRTAWNPNSYKFTVDLQAGERRKIKLDWKPDGGTSYIGLKALSPKPIEEQNKLAL